MQKVKSIEGVRTIAWIGVFIGHYCGAFLPDRKWITDSILFIRFLYSGDAQIRVFFVISGIVLSLKYFSRECWDNALKDIIRRYFRLMVPILIAELAVYALMRSGAIYNLKAASILGSESFLGQFNNFSPRLSECIKEASIGVFLLKTAQYIGPLWTMTYEFLGSVLVICALAVLRKSNWRWVFYTLFLYAFNSYYNYFILGMIISDIYVNYWETRKKRSALNTIIVLIGYGVMSFCFFQLKETEKLIMIPFFIGFAMFFIGIMSSKIFDFLLGNPLMEKLGSISFSAYLLHWPIIETFSCKIFLILYGNGVWSRLVNLALFLATFILVITLSLLYKRHVEPLGGKL